MAPSDSATGRLRSRVRHQEVVAELGRQGPPDDAIACVGRQTPRISVLADKHGQEWTTSVRDRGIGIGLVRRHPIAERHDAEAATGTTTDHE